MDKIRIGVLGCSAIAGRSVIPAIMAHPGFELSLVASRSEEKGREFSERFGVRHCSYDDLLGGDLVDAVYVSLPVGLHFEWGMRVIESGKHLLMEKTFTHSLSTAEQVISLARSKNRIAMEALMYVHHPLLEMVSKMVAGGEIGELRSIDAVFGFPHLPAGDIRYRKDLGGGAILDSLVYPLSLCLHMMGEPGECHAAVMRDPGYDVDSRGFLQLSGKGVNAHVTYGFGFMYRNEYLLWGSEGYLRVQRAFSRPPGMEGAIELFRQGEARSVPVGAADHFYQMVDAFEKKVSGVDASGINEGKDVLARMRIISGLHEKHG